ncbi:HlyD family secretion protein [Roseateles violae]|uniref:HlyD family efflux transporter periplasmic adaptor subunit n=1 Tax=Roseateles violae TaxID=3058042 RepID=A0ABT8DMB6_9BURK|nr:HlyD family efflux transporter periplasmic adaptor subunit [Pelomonas sp. PFR6]MDN3919541.1 HlyD family efflux transporter periplasmic adaptor subunit [Pelomonas sp. PFR6]
MRTIIGPALSVAALLCCSACSDSGPPGYQGYVEGEYVHIAAPIGGRLQKLQVQRGQTVAARAALFSLESDEEQAARAQAEQQLKAAQAQLADLRQGRRSPELEVVQAQLAQAQAAEAQAAQQLKRDEDQFEAGGIARAQLDDARANLAIRQARVRELAGQLQVSRLPAREEQIRAQDAQVAAARAALSQLDWRLGQKQLLAGQAGLVVDTLYREGEWVPAGSPVVRLLPPGHVKLRFFVPEPQLGGLKPGARLRIQCEGCPAELAAQVSYVASEAEYTPPVIYSKDTRAKLVFMVEARPAEADAARLRVGQPVTVTLP